jgi:hypothetical protein
MLYRIAPQPLLGRRRFLQLPSLVALNYVFVEPQNPSSPRISFELGRRRIGAQAWFAPEAPHMPQDLPRLLRIHVTRSRISRLSTNLGTQSKRPTIFRRDTCRPALTLGSFVYVNCAWRGATKVSPRIQIHFPATLSTGFARAWGVRDAT